jgi:hypothetical protein
MVLKAEKKLDLILERLDAVLFGLDGVIITQLELASILRREFSPPVKIKLSLGDTMSDTVFSPGQSSTATITLLDTDGNAVSGALIDAGSLVASFADGTTSFTLAPGADTSSFTITANADAVAITDDVLTVNGNFNSVPLTAGSIACDIAVPVPADTPVAIQVALSTPA